MKLLSYCKEMWCDLPLHVKPSPEYPLLHMQLSKFALFEHVAFPLQGPESHTSISRGIEANTLGYYFLYQSQIERFLIIITSTSLFYIQFDI